MKNIHKNLTLTFSVLIIGLSVQAKAWADDDTDNASEEAKHSKLENGQKAERHAKSKTKNKAKHAKHQADDSFQGRHSKRGESHKGKGHEKSAEMKARRDERNRIRDDYHANRDTDGAGEIKEPGTKPAKKPWWKFWRSQEAADAS